MIIADYVADRVVRVARRFAKCNRYWLMTTKRRMYPFVDAGRGAFLSAGIRSDDQIFNVIFMNTINIVYGYL